MGARFNRLLSLLSLMVLSCGGAGGSAFSRDAKGQSLAEKCRDGRGEACFELGRHLLDQGVPASDDAQALNALELGCNFGHPQSCGYLGAIYLEIHGNRPNPRAVELLTKSCESNVAGACIYLARWRLEQGTPMDDAEALRLLRKAALLGDPESNFLLGLIHESGRGVVSDLNQAARWYDEGCARGFGDACLKLAEILDTMTAPDPTRFGQLLHRACELGSGHACAALAARYVDLSSNSYDCTSAMIYARRACSSRYVDGCGLLAICEARATAVPPRKGDALYRTCEGGSSDACHYLGSRLWSVSTDSATRGEALRVFAQGCRLGNAESCTAIWDNAGALEGTGVSVFELLEKLERSCMGKNASACLVLSGVYEAGKWVAKDIARAESLRQRACESKSRVGQSNTPKGCRSDASVPPGGEGQHQSE